ncbi:metal dependent phosphohydrolase [Mycobacteroides abscessus subsp. abscessus]|uniref:HDIG domain-containing metalloprotein n=1 Tax=Mycobacteroides abscessus TaxID=36809 RepID=UPI00092B379B|nr:HDIG domain-containing metalloprotein [Mycobacteroides abscessus]SIJ22307.1 metal dependent phosphohydrolase [Mycobacteroides abscessus subsp. abscessus]SLH38422.1 metal dependent phosphohydrolase [Mycobacteroides abscessus subsp. abscessus]
MTELHLDLLSRYSGPQSFTLFERVTRALSAAKGAWREVPVRLPDNEFEPGRTDDIAGAAHGVAQIYLEGSAQRCSHTRMVAIEARRLSAILVPGVADLIVAAAWLHDVGYSNSWQDTGFHPLDGARAAERLGFPLAVVELVAHHTGARYEALERNLSEQLSSYSTPPQAWLSILNCADLTTGPHGAPVTAAERIDEVLQRYSPDHPVARAIQRSGGDLVGDAEATLALAERVESDLRAEAGTARALEEDAGVQSVKSIAASAGWRIADEYLGRCTFVSGRAEVWLRWAYASDRVVDYAALQIVGGKSLQLPGPDTRPHQIRALTEWFGSYAAK